MITIMYTGQGVLPSYQSPYSAGVDVICQPPTTSQSQVPYWFDGYYEIPPMAWCLIPTALRILDFQKVKVGDVELIPYLMVVPRSGLALAHAITSPNSPAIIDADYPGEIGMIVQNLSNNFVAISPGDRIGQLVGAYTFRIGGVLVNQTPRTGGFGSTGR